MLESREGQVGWSKGLTKETDSRVKHMSDSLKGRKVWNKGLTKETDERVRSYGRKITESKRN